jgi:hypothetical protein
MTYILLMITVIDFLFGMNGSRYDFTRTLRLIAENFNHVAQANGPLTTENVFEYFTTSMFYDKQSNNQVLRMQTMHTGQPLVNEAEELRCPASIGHRPTSWN